MEDDDDISKEEIIDLFKDVFAQKVTKDHEARQKRYKRLQDSQEALDKANEGLSRNCSDKPERGRDERL